MRGPEGPLEQLVVVSAGVEDARAVVKGRVVGSIS